MVRRWQKQPKLAQRSWRWPKRAKRGKNGRKWPNVVKNTQSVFSWVLGPKGQTNFRPLWTALVDEILTITWETLASFPQKKAWKVCAANKKSSTNDPSPKKPFHDMAPKIWAASSSGAEHPICSCHCPYHPGGGGAWRSLGEKNLCCSRTFQNPQEKCQKKWQRLAKTGQLRFKFAKASKKNLHGIGMRSRTIVFHSQH